MAAPHIHDLASIIDDLDRMGRLTRVTSEVDPAYDLAGLAHRLEGGERAVLFEKVKGHAWPVFVGLYWNRNLLAAVMRRDAATLPQHVADCIHRWQQKPVDPVIVPTGPVLDVTEREVDLSSIPVPTHAGKDGGPYFAAAVVIAKDPETGVRNASIQRFQVAGRNTLRVNIDAGRHLELYLAKAAKLGRTLTFTLNCGVGPGLHFAASTPAEAAPAEADELGIASEFDGRPLELVKASNGYDDMVANAMWALECEIVPGEVADEGPFGEVTGCYAKVAPRPVVHVRKIHRRARPVFQTILSGMEVWNSVGLLGEANVLALLQRQVPGVSDVYFSHGGGGFYHAIVKMRQARAGWSKQAIMAAFAAFPPLKMVTVVDDDVDIYSATDVEWAMATRFNPRTGIVVIDESFGHGLNPSFPEYLGPKVGFDATQPVPHRAEFERVTYRPMALDAVRITERAVQAPLAAAGGAQDPFTRPAARTKAEIQAWEAGLARPRPIEPADLRGPKTASAEKDDNMSHDPDAWIARPQPARLDAHPGRERDDDDDPDAWIARPRPAQLDPFSKGTPGNEDDEDDDPDAWIARPQPAVLTAPGAVARPETSGEPAKAADPDADLARPQPIDLAALGWRDSPAGAEDDDPDAWIARPRPATFDIPQAPPLVDAEARRAALKKAKNTRTDDPDAWISRPQPASFAIPVPVAPAAPAPIPAATDRAVNTPPASNGDRQEEEVAPDARSAPKSASKSAPKLAPKPVSASATGEPEGASRPEPRPRVKPEARPAPTSDIQFEPKPAAKPAPAAQERRAARLVGAGPTRHAREGEETATAKSDSRGGAAAFFEATTASAPAPRVGSTLRGNGRSTPRPAPAKPTASKSRPAKPPADKEGGFFR
ncbi:MAG: UbiD family decarboxylase [Bauldia litoralis]